MWFILQGCVFKACKHEGEMFCVLMITKISRIKIDAAKLFWKKAA